MKIKPTTLALVLMAGLLGGVVYLTLITDFSEPGAEEGRGQRLFRFEEAQVKSLKIDTQTETLSFEKDGDGVWQMRQPEQGAANDASIAYVLNLMATGTSDRTLTIPVDEAGQFGLQRPLATLEVTLEDDSLHRLVLGNYNFDQSFLYALADPYTEETSTLPILLVSSDFENAVTRPLTEWKQAPEEAPASSESPDAEGSPSPEGSSSDPSPSLQEEPPDASPSAEPSDAEASPSPSDEVPSSPAPDDPEPDSSPSPEASPTSP